MTTITFRTCRTHRNSLSGDVSPVSMTLRHEPCLHAPRGGKRWVVREMIAGVAYANWSFPTKTAARKFIFDRDAIVSEHESLAL